LEEIVDLDQKSWQIISRGPKLFPIWDIGDKNKFQLQRKLLQQAWIADLSSIVGTSNSQKFFNEYYYPILKLQGISLISI
jgi:hypothetical protein